MNKFVSLGLLCLGALASCTSESSQKNTLSVPQLFTDHMVLQQQQNGDFWGTGTPQKEVEVSASWGKDVHAVADANGKWKLELETPAAGGPYTIQITSGGDSLAIGDVLIGEVWLAAGQSNMEMPLAGWPPNDTIIDSAEEIAKSDLPNIRFMRVAHNVATVPLDSVGGNWQVISPKTSGEVGATAYFFAKKLYGELKVPIGVIQSVVGGTPAEAWTSEQSLEKLNGFSDPIAKLKNNAGAKKEWFQKFQSQEIPATTKEWETITLNDDKASMPGYDDSKWDTLDLPERIDILKDGEFDGAIWLRKTFALTDIKMDYVLDIASIDDMVATYINGKKVGGIAGVGHANAPREMRVPKSLLVKGTNTIAIRVIDSGGPGSMCSVVLSNAKGDTISLNGTWKSRLVGQIADNRFYTYSLQQDLSKRPYHNTLPIHPPFCTMQ